jgi:hypothetical protein
MWCCCKRLAHGQGLQFERGTDYSWHTFNLTTWKQSRWAVRNVCNQCYNYLCATTSAWPCVGVQAFNAFSEAQLQMALNTFLELRHQSC